LENSTNKSDRKPFGKKEEVVKGRRKVVTSVKLRTS